MSNCCKEKCPPSSFGLWFISVAIGVAVLVGCAGTYDGRDADRLPPLSEREKDAGLQALLTPADYEELSALPDSARSGWLRMFWQAHDPTPTTPENEFRDEHHRRLRYSLYYFSNPLGPLPWDDRGEVYIRYGEPNQRIMQLDNFWDRRDALGARGSRLKGLSRSEVEQRDFSGDASSTDEMLRIPNRDSEFMVNSRGPDGEVWEYYRYGLTFQFQDEDGLGIFTMVPLSDGITPEQTYGDFVQTRVTVVDLQPAIYLHDYGSEHLDYALDLARFRTEGREFTVDVNLGYPLAELGRGGRDSAQVSLRRVIVVRDDSLREVASDLSVLSRRVGRSNGEQQLMVEQKNFTLPPGGYELSVSIEDLYSGKRGTYIKYLRLPEFASREVQEISDIQLASFVWSVYEPGSPYVKSNRLVMPLPSHVYLEEQPIAFYYEVYNLARNAGDSAIYNITYEILDPTAQKSHRKKKVGTFTAEQRDVYQFGSIDSHGLDPGEYLLSIDVLDEITNKTKRTLTRFKIIPARESP